MSTLNTAAPTVRIDLAVLAWVERHPVIAMVTLMYLLAWPKLLASATDSYGLTQLHLPPLLDSFTGWARAIAAFTITALVQGKQGVQELGRKILRWRVGAGWYGVVLVGSAIMILVEGGTYELLTWNWTALPITQMALPQAAILFGLMLLLYMVVNTEEIAWRGFALPRLQSQYGALGATVLLWIPWTLFHLPYFFTKGSMFQQMGILGFASGTLTMSIVFTWLFNSTKGSVFICTLLHAALNTWPLLLMPPQSTMPGFFGYTSDVAITLFFVLAFGAARLSRKRDKEPFLY